MNVHGDFGAQQKAIERVGVFFEYLRLNGRTSILIRAMEAEYSAALGKPNPKAIKQLVKEMRELLREIFTPSQRTELTRLLESRGLATDADSESLRIAKLLKKKKISTRGEFELLAAFVNEKVQAGEMLAEVEIANKLLHEFESGKKARIKKAG
jgi:DNA-binding response OmpR family regulator